jgi:hypothetical protein
MVWAGVPPRGGPQVLPWGWRDQPRGKQDSAPKGQRVSTSTGPKPHGNDPSAGSPTETLLRLLLPLNDWVRPTFRLWVVVANLPEPVRGPHRAVQSVVATGGVYKGQGRNQRVLMTRAYQAFLVGEQKLQGSIPSTAPSNKITHASRRRK